MSDSPKDRSKVSVTEPSEIAFWCQKLSCSETQLRAAVKMVNSKQRAPMLSR